MNIRAAFKFRYVKVAIGKTENGSITIKTAEGKTVKNGASVFLSARQRRQTTVNLEAGQEASRVQKLR